MAIEMDRRRGILTASALCRFTRAVVPQAILSTRSAVRRSQLRQIISTRLPSSTWSATPASPSSPPLPLPTAPFPSSTAMVSCLDLPGIPSVFFLSKERWEGRRDCGVDARGHSLGKGDWAREGGRDERRALSSALPRWPLPYSRLAGKCGEAMSAHHVMGTPPHGVSLAYFRVTLSDPSSPL